MNEALKTYIDRYAQLELGMRALINRKGNSLCAGCSCVCCDAVMCVEAMKSPFLKLVHQQENEYDEEKGFLRTSGCALKKGRPSVCYEYFCDDHFYHQPDELHAEVLRVIGSLLFHATRNALGDVALEDLQHEDELEQLDFARLNEQLVESERAVEIIRAFYRDGTLSDEALRILRGIHLSDI